MKRRDFIGRSAVITAGVASMLTTGCHTPEIKPKEEAPEDLTAFVLDEATIDGLQEKVKAGTLSYEQITMLYIKRIEQIDKAGPKLNAIIELNPDAIAIAKAMDAEQKSGKLRSPLHGMPILIKDNIDTADKMQTTAGALAMEGNIAKEDSFIVTKLRDAGAVILGKTNLSEWANFRSTHSCSGWSSRGGQTKNPYILDHNPCGSSAGSGAAVSANLCVVAIGTETDGSITCPASVNGVVGIKPTVGLVSRSGIIPISSTQDTAGPLARTVRDAAIVLEVIAGIDEKDAITKTGKMNAEKPFVKFLDTNALKGLRIGIEKKPQGNNPLLHQLQNDTLAILKQAGATIIELEYLDKMEKFASSEFEVMQHEFKDGLNRYLANSNSKMKTLTDIIAFNTANESKAMPYFKQETLESSDKKEGMASATYKKAVEQSHHGSVKFLNELFEKNQLVALAGLTMGPACSIDTIYGDRWGDVFLTMPAAISGFPHISVPCGMIYDLPVGFSFFGPAYSEGMLFAMAYAFEQAAKKRVTPKFKTAFL